MIEKVDKKSVSVYFLETAYKEYSRINAEYDNIYNRTCGALVLCSGVLLSVIGFVFSKEFCFQYLSLFTKMSIYLGFLMVFFAMMSLLYCLKGQTLEVLNTDDFSSEFFYHKGRKTVQKWVVKNLVYCISINKKVRQFKQNYFNHAINYFAIGIISMVAGFIWEVIK